MIERLWALADAIEVGGRPVRVGLAGSAGLALFTPIRFGVLVALMTPADFGRLSIFTSLTALLPHVLVFGTSLQFQRIARFAGAGVSGRLIGWGLRAVAAMWPIGLVISFLAAWPFSEGNVLLPVMVATQSAGTAMVTLMAQFLLGRGRRSLSVGLTFANNSATTLGVLVLVPLGLAGELPAVLATWMATAVVAAAASISVVRAAERRVGAVSDGTESTITPSLREGLLSLPSLAGVWLLLLVTRVAIGTAIGPDALAAFSLAWTAADLAFLVSVSLITTSSTGIMDGTVAPTHSFVRAASALAALVVVAALGVPVLLALVAQEGYEFSLCLLAILAVASASRLAISAWLPVAVRVRAVWVLSAAYGAGAGLLAPALSVLRPPTTELYALAFSLAVVTVAVVHVGVTTSVGSRRPA